MENDIVECSAECGGEVDFGSATHHLPADHCSCYGVCSCNRCGKAYFHSSRLKVSRSGDAGTIEEVFVINGNPVYMTRDEMAVYLEIFKNRSAANIQQ
ncbi:MAG: hypothetical protein ACD_15C00037G0001 [uncultured bacterium]|nr:MAG: hypothetical protein ACD_15C00037G0001 [uncultured bacterium]HCU71113.1 hypothetical protein [Candidatus Moranbacteria bacterium]